MLNSNCYLYIFNRKENIFTVNGINCDPQDWKENVMTSILSESGAVKVDTDEFLIVIVKR